MSSFSALVLFDLHSIITIYKPLINTSRVVGKLMSEIVTDNKTLLESVNVRLSSPHILSFFPSVISFDSLF